MARAGGQGAVLCRSDISVSEKKSHIDSFLCADMDGVRMQRGRIVQTTVLSVSGYYPECRKEVYEQAFHGMIRGIGTVNKYNTKHEDRSFFFRKSFSAFFFRKKLSAFFFRKCFFAKVTWST